MKTQLRISAARDILTRPDLVCTMPTVMAAQWAFLKEQRSQPVNFDRVGSPAHLIETTPINPIVADFKIRSPRVTARIQARAAECGYPFCGELIARRAAMQGGGV